MGTGVTVFGFQFENWQKKNSPHKDILSTTFWMSPKGPVMAETDGGPNGFNSSPAA